MTEPKKPSTAKSATKIMAAVLGSRILGLVREMVLSFVFGASRELDALKVAFRIPNLLRDLFAEGALSTAFVTTFSQTMATNGKASALRLANLVFNILVVALSLICLLGIVFSDPLVHLIAPAFAETAGKLTLTVNLTQIMFPFILFAALAALYMGLLNSLGSFGLPASASMAFNIISIIAGGTIAWCFDPTFQDKEKCVTGFAIGVLLGGLAQWAVQIPRARKFGFRFVWIFDLRDSGLKKILMLMGPAIIGVAAVQINVLISTYFAAGFGNGAITWLDNAFRLMQMPIGMFGVAISTVMLPSVSRSAALNNLDEFKHSLQESMRYMLFLAIPSTAGLALMSTPIIGALFQHGAYHSSDTAQTATLLRYYSIGLISYSAIKVLAPAFYALNKVWIPVRISISGILLNILLNYWFIRILGLGLYSLPLSISLVALLNFGQLWFWLRFTIGNPFDKAFLISLAKILAATFVMADVVYGLNWLFTDTLSAWLHDVHIWIFKGQSIACIIQAFVISGIGATTYFGVAWLFKLDEAQRIYRALTAKFLKPTAHPFRSAR
jgi:putative peptidoglycan lipid II flippase